MRRMRFWGSAALCLSLLATVRPAQAQQPVGTLIPPRTDLNSVYADSYMNPLCAGPDSSHQFHSDPSLWNPGRRWRFYGGAEFMQLSRSNPDEQILLRQDPGIQTPVLIDDRPFRLPLFTTDGFDFGNERDGWRATIGVELSDTDSVDLSFQKLSGLLPSQVVLVAGDINASTFALEINDENSTAGPGVWFPRSDVLLNPNDAGISRLGENFGAQYIDDQLWGLDLLWRHALDHFEFNNGNWRVMSLAGVRMIHTAENFQLFWNRNTVAGWDPFAANPVLFDGLVPNGLFDPRGTAVDGFRMELDVRNLIVGPQFGLQAKRRFYQIFEFDLLGKGGFMANFTEISQDVRRFDGLIIPDITRAPFTRNDATTAGVIEGQFKINFYPHPNIKFAVGIESMYLRNIVTATKQIEPNLERQSRPDASDDAFYFGWTGSAEVKF